MGCCHSNRHFAIAPTNQVSPAPLEPCKRGSTAPGSKTPHKIKAFNNKAKKRKMYRDACTAPLEPFDFGNKVEDDGVRVVRVHQANSSANLKQQGKPLSWEDMKENRLAQIFSDEPVGPANVAEKPSFYGIEPKMSLPGQVAEQDAVKDLAMDCCLAETLEEGQKTKYIMKIDAAGAVANVDAEVVDDSPDCRQPHKSANENITSQNEPTSDDDANCKVESHTVNHIDNVKETHKPDGFASKSSLMAYQDESEEVDNYSNGKRSIAVVERTEPDVSCQKEEPTNMKGDTSHEEDKTGNHAANQVTLQSTSHERTAKEAIMAYEEILMAIASDTTANDTVSETRKVDYNQLEQSKQNEGVDTDGAMKESLADYANDNVREECFTNGRSSLLAGLRSRELMTDSHTQLVSSTAKPKPRRISIVTLGSILDSDISITTMSRAALIDQEPSNVVESYVPSDVHDEKGIVIDIDGNVINDQPKNAIAAKVKIDDKNNDMAESAAVVSFKTDFIVSSLIEQGADNVERIIAETSSAGSNQNGKAQNLIQGDSRGAVTSKNVSKKQANYSDDKNIGIAVDRMLAVSDFPKEDVSVSELIHDLEMLIQNDPQIEINKNVASTETKATDASVCDFLEPEQAIVSDPWTKPKPTGIDKVDKRAPIESSSLLVDAKTPDHGESVELKHTAEEIIQGGKIGHNDLIGKGLIDMPLDRNSATTSAETAQAPMALEAIAKEAVGKDIAKQEVMEQEVVSNQSVFEADQVTPLNSHTIISKDKFNDLEIGADHEEEVTLDKGSNESQSPYISDFCPSNEDKVEPLVSLCTIDDRGNYHSIEDVYSDESETVIAMLTCDEADKINHEVEMTYEDVSEQSMGSGISRELETAYTAFTDVAAAVQAATTDNSFTDAGTDDTSGVNAVTIDSADAATSSLSASTKQPSQGISQDCSKSKNDFGGT